MSSPIHTTRVTAPPLALPRRRWRALVLLALAQFLVVLNTSIVNVALSAIGRRLDLSAAGLSRVVNAYLLTFGGLLLLGGRHPEPLCPEATTHPLKGNRHELSEPPDLPVP